MKLIELLEAIGCDFSRSNSEPSATSVISNDITGIAYHSERVEIGNLFVCVKGFKTDGHRYLKSAVEKGAVAAIVETIQDDVSIPQFVVDDSRLALAHLASAYYDAPSTKMNMIGITATNGKTTTSYMVNAIFKAHGLKTGLVGTVAVQMEGESIPADLTTPESLDLQYYFSRMVDKKVTHAIMEVSSSALELNRVAGVTYDIVTLNNVSRDHIDTHGSFDKYFHFKSSLIKNASPDAFAVLNLDCPYSESMINQTEAKVVSFGLNHDQCHLHCKNLDLSTGRGVFTVEIKKAFQGKEGLVPCGEFDVSLSVPGLHSVYNAMVAIAVALITGIPVPTIQKALKTFRGVERRFEYIFEDAFKIVDDHFANPGNIDVTLKTLDYMTYENLHLVYAVRGQRGPTVNRENALAISAWAEALRIKRIIATLSEEYVTSKDVVSKEELDVFMEVMQASGIEVVLFNTLNDAAKHALDSAGSGDLILMGGCQGMDFGAEAILSQLEKRRPDYPAKVLYAALQDRIAGVTPAMSQHLNEILER